MKFSGPAITYTLHITMNEEIIRFFSYKKDAIILNKSNLQKMDLKIVSSRIKIFVIVLRISLKNLRVDRWIFFITNYLESSQLRARDMIFFFIIRRCQNFLQKLHISQQFLG